MGLSGNGALPVWIPDDNVGVRAHGYDSLSRVQVEDPGGVRAGDRDETLGIHYAGVDALFPEHGQSVLDAVHAVRDLREVLLTQSLLLGVERGVVAADNLQIISEKRPY